MGFFKVIYPYMFSKIYQKGSYFFIVLKIRIMLILRTKKITSAARILIIKPEAIGDFAIFLPYLINFIKQLPKGREVTLFINDLNAEIAKYFLKDVEIISFSRKKLYEERHYFKQQVERLTKWDYEQILYPSYSRELFIDLCLFAQRSKAKIGYLGDSSNISVPLKYCTSLFYHRLIPAPEKIAEEVIFSQFFTSVDNNYKYQKIDLKLPSQEYEQYRNYIAIFPGSSWVGKNWPLQNFKELIEKLTDEGHKIILLGGPGEVSMQKDLPAVESLIGKTSLLELFQVLKNVSLLISNDSSALHMAEFVQTKSVGILGGGHFGRFLPKINSSTSHVVYKKLNCYHCLWNCPYIKNNVVKCIDEVSVIDVHEKVKSVL
jgi:ADP-heptose:LPS heptosyltransferase